MAQRAALLLACLAAAVQAATRGGTCAGAVSVCAHAGNGSVAVGLCGADSARAGVATVTAEFEGVSAAHGGWPLLRVTGAASDAVPDAAVMRAAGFAEGYLTQPWVDEMRRRVGAMRTESARAQLRGFIDVQFAHIRRLIAGGGASGPPGLPPSSGGEEVSEESYVRVLALFVAQVEGLVEGYNAAAPGSPISLMDVLELNYDGDAFDILQTVDSGVASFAAHAGKRRSLSRLPRFAGAAQEEQGAAALAAAAEGAAPRQQVLDAAEQPAAPAAAAVGAADAPFPAAPLRRLPADTYDLDSWVRLSAAGHCTAAVVAKDLAGGGFDLWVAHNTWADFLELVRVWKVYDLRLRDPAVAAAHPAGAAPASRYRSSFSSYPGMVTSTDDWYLLSSGLLVTETTTAAVDGRALRRISPRRGLPAWLRVSVANALARDAAAWAALFARRSGGTYNCMWLVLDAAAVQRARVTRLADLPDRALVVVEQSPARVLAVDATPTLRRTGLWVSANRPSLTAVRRDLGYPEEPPAVADALALRWGGREGVGDEPPPLVSARSRRGRRGRRSPTSAAVVTTMTTTRTETAAVSGGLLLSRFAAVDATEQQEQAEAALDASILALEWDDAPSYSSSSFSAGRKGGAAAAGLLDGVAFVARSRGGEGLAPGSLLAGAAALPPRFREMAGGAVDAESAAEAVAEAESGSSSAAARRAAAAKPPASYFSAFNNPRARILRRESAAVSSAAHMQALIRHNRWAGDAESAGRPYLAVSARFDLAAEGDAARAANGGLDAKVASLADVLALRTRVVMGPTADDQPPFDWRAWRGPGYCDSAAGSGAPCPPGSSGGKPVVDVRSLCRDEDGEATAAAAAGGGARCPVSLPCVWSFPWGAVQA